MHRSFIALALAALVGPLLHRQPTPAAISVLLLSRRPIVVCFALDEATVTDDTGSTVSGLAEETRLVARPVEDRVELVNAAGGRIAVGLQLTLDASGRFELEQPPGKSRGFRGQLILRNEQGAVTAINRVGLEDYLQGVLPMEAAPSAHVEYLRAHAIASRSAALARSGRHRAQGYDLCGTTHCEQYGGLDPERATTSAAVFDTRGRVLIAGGRPVDAVYSTNCGGVTAGNEEVWLNKPVDFVRPTFDFLEPREGLALPMTSEALSKLLRNGADANCAPEAATTVTSASAARRAEAFRWKRTFTAAELDQRLTAVGLGALTDLLVAERGTSGRVIELKLIGSLKATSLRGDGMIRSTMQLPSTLFDLELKRNESGNLIEATIIGGGFGHGVGLCQHGAMNLARRGWSHEAILRKYFVGVELPQQ